MLPVWRIRAGQALVMHDVRSPYVRRRCGERPLAILLPVRGDAGVSTLLDCYAAWGTSPTPLAL